MQAKAISEDVLTVLSGADVDGNTIRLTGQLDRKLYLATNEILEAMGGQWNRRAKGHVFSECPTDRLDQVMLTGRIELPKDYGYFPTPPWLAQRLVDYAEIEPPHFVLEPSAGQGAIAEAIVKVVAKAHLTCIEILPANVAALQAKGFIVFDGDFLKLSLRSTPFDRIVMNPPFARQQDIDHVCHAWELLGPAGRLVSIMALGFTFRQDRKATEFRAFVEQHGWWEPNPDGAFAESGTEVKTVTVVLDKSAGAR